MLMLQRAKSLLVRGGSISAPTFYASTFLPGIVPHTSLDLKNRILTYSPQSRPPDRWDQSGLAFSSGGDINQRCGNDLQELLDENRQAKQKAEQKRCGPLNTYISQDKLADYERIQKSLSQQPSRYLQSATSKNWRDLYDAMNILQAQIQRYETHVFLMEMGCCLFHTFWCSNCHYQVAESLAVGFFLQRGSDSYNQGEQKMIKKYFLNSMLLAWCLLPFVACSDTEHSSSDEEYYWENGQCKTTNDDDREWVVESALCEGYYLEEGRCYNENDQQVDKKYCQNIQPGQNSSGIGQGLAGSKNFKDPGGHSGEGGTMLMQDKGRKQHYYKPEAHKPKSLQSSQEDMKCFINGQIVDDQYCYMYQHNQEQNFNPTSKEM